MHVLVGDGYAVWLEYAPYDAILVAAAAKAVPQPLIDQLKINGRLVMPVGSLFNQNLIRLTKTPKGMVEEIITPVIFVPFQRGTY